MSTPHITPVSTATPDPQPRFLSEADCHDILQRLQRYAQGGGTTGVLITSTWRGNVRWARNLVSSAEDLRTNHLIVNRDLHGATCGFVEFNETTDDALVAALRRAERLARLNPEGRNSELMQQVWQEPAMAPVLFSETTYQLDAEQRAVAARTLAESAAQAGMLSAGYIDVSARSVAFLNTAGITRYFQYTWAQYSVTVRDSQGTGSGWAGVDWPDWSKVDGAKLSAVALQKCLDSRNPVAIEPGRYTTILEPQAVCDFVQVLVNNLGRHDGSCPNETCKGAPFNKEPQTYGMGNSPGFSLLGERVVDERITMGVDPLDPELGFPPFGVQGDVFSGILSMAEAPVYHPATWIEHGVLTNLAYDRYYGQTRLGRSNGLPNAGAFRMSGGETSIAEMIATTKRGLLVTRFDQVTVLVDRSLLCRGYTRDGLWLIENGKISKPVKNLAFTESVLFALNNLEQLGPPQRVFHPPGTEWSDFPQPAVVPPLKVRDFSFTALVDAV